MENQQQLLAPSTKSTLKKHRIQELKKKSLEKLIGRSVLQNQHQGGGLYPGGEGPLAEHVSSVGKALAVQVLLSPHPLMAPDSHCFSPTQEIGGNSPRELSSGIHWRDTEGIYQSLLEELQATASGIHSSPFSLPNPRTWGLRVPASFQICFSLRV